MPEEEVTVAVPEQDELRLRLLGASGHQDAKAVHRALGALISLVSHLQEPGERVALSQVGTGSTVVAVRPEGISEDVGHSVRTIVAGVTALEERAGIPDGWDARMVQDIIDIGRAVEASGIEGAELDWEDHPPVRIDQQVRLNAEASLRVRSVSLGSVQGRIDRWVNRSNRHEAGLVDEVTGRAVKITFSTATAPAVFAALEHRVAVWGEVQRNGEGQKVGVHAEDVVLLPEEQGPAGSMRGALGNWTDGKDTVMWVRAQRGYTPTSHGA